MPEKDALPVLIAGAGIGGLTLAVALRRAGIAFRLFERAPILEPVGAGIVMQPNAMRALRFIDPALEQAVASEGQVCIRGSIRDARGAELSAMPLEAIAKQVEAPVIAIHRHRLHAVLRAAVGEHAIHLGAAAIGCRQEGDEVVLCLEGGREERGSLLVGADGLRSAIRGHVVGDEALRYSGYTSWRGVCEGAGLVEPGQQSETWGRGQRFGIVSIGHGEVYWFATANAPAGEADPQGRRVASLLQRFADWHAPIGSLLERTDEARCLRSDIFDRVPITRWSKGHVTLLGDAAHPTTPNLGQGGCLAIEDAAVLAKLLATKPRPALAEVLAMYEARRVSRANGVVERSRNVGRLGQLESVVGTALRNTAMRLTPSSVAANSLLELYRFEVN
jgi:2-polyprenyl-6-methoxyphenol hydroxylase-like FAD-dependent oxidoreductase